MPPTNLYSVQQSRIWTELINKEDSTRLQWYDKTKKGELKGETNRFEVFKKQLERNAIKGIKVRELPPIDRTAICRKSQKSFLRSLDKTAIERADIILSKSTNSHVFDMYPVESPVRKLLYEGFSREDKGKLQYLKSRSKTIPERRYQFPLCSNWDYGWRLDDHIPKDSIKAPTYARRAIVESDFFTRNELPSYHRDRHLKADDARAFVFLNE